MTVVEVKPNIVFSWEVLQKQLPDIESALFFGKLYKLDVPQLSALLSRLFNTSLVQALVGEGDTHSTELQDYLVDICEQHNVYIGEVKFADDPEPRGELLPELWKNLEVQVASSIQQVAETLKNVVGQMPGKQGEMVFRSMMLMNAKRPTIGDYRAKVHHAPGSPNLVILDVSGSMSQHTIETIVEDVVALSYMADAHLAIVSNTTTHWHPGEFSVETVLKASEFGGTHYESLAPLFNQDWGVVVTIADYDSSRDAKAAVGRMSGRIEQVLDVSLVSKPTFLSEVVGQLAQEVKPLLVAANGCNLTH